MRSRSIRLKSPDDIQRIRDAGIIIADIFHTISGTSLDGMSTWELDSLIENMILKRRGRPAFKTVPRYSAASCISINNEVVHGVPSKKRRIKGGDLVKVDIGVVLNGYFADACRTVAVDEVPDNARRLFEIAGRVLERAIDVMHPGNRLGDIGHAIQSYSEKKGYSVVRNYTGHGVGFALHEPPVVPHFGKKGTGIVLETGMVLAVEPMINEGEHDVRLLKDGWTAVTVDGRLSAQFEHTIAVTKDGPRILTE